ncbi:DUF2567 domain-containing protein [Dactylosporangium sp. NPDC050688]|uniref:DUF2567 domain-containing protein n=1 Tax=Dactylosporangium sp. NPDC050688 TaxID=3157217 RepID=UPI0033D226EA
MSIAPIEPIDQPELPEPSPPRRRSPGLEVLFGLVVAVVVAALGAPIGLLWSWVAPEVELVQTQYGPYPVEGEPEGYFADDGWFMIIGALAGVVLAVAAWIVLRRYRGPIVLAGLVIGSAAGAALAAWLGNKIGYAHYLDLVEHAPAGTHIFRPAKVRAGEAGLLYGVIPWVQGSLLIQAIAAAVVYTGLAGFHASPTLTYDPDPMLPFDPAYQPVYAGYPYGDPSQQPAYGPAAGPWPAEGQPGAGPWPGSGSWPEAGPAGGGPVNGQRFEQPGPGLVDLSKPGSSPSAEAGPVTHEAGAAPEGSGPARPAPPPPAPEEWRAP